MNHQNIEAQKNLTSLLNEYEEIKKILKSQIEIINYLQLGKIKISLILYHKYTQEHSSFKNIKIRILDEKFKS